MSQRLIVTTSFEVEVPDGTDADDVHAAVAELQSKSTYAGMLEDGSTFDRTPGSLFVHATLIMPEHVTTATG